MTIYDKGSGEAEETIALQKLKIDEMHELLRSRGFVRRAGGAPSSGDQGDVSDLPVRQTTRAAKVQREKPFVDDNRPIRLERARAKAKAQKERARVKKRKRAREESGRERIAWARELEREAAADREIEGVEPEVPPPDAMAAKRKFDRAKHEARLDGEL